MDCNSYSYAPTMLDEDQDTLASYKNDDMEVCLECIGPRQRLPEYHVWAFSYDGQLDVAELFFDRAPAERLYNFIRENYSDTPPGDELGAFIESLPNRYGGEG